LKGAGVLVVGVEGDVLDPGEWRLLSRLQPFGVILVQRNVTELEPLRALLAQIRAACPRALLLIDAEGGRVDRLRGILGPAPAAADLARRPPALSRRAGRWIGAALAGLGFDLDFAPVVDLDRGHRDNALDRRCLGSKPRQVVARAKAFIEGLEASGVASCVKHFPGLGGAGRDTHLEPARIDLPAGDLARDLAPFVALAARSGSIMVGHGVYPALDPGLRPATLSPAIATELVRRSFPFRGALFSDDLEMQALAPFGDLGDRGEGALVAGCDALLFCRRLEAAPEIAARLARPRLARRRRQAEARLERLRRGVARLRRSAGAPPPLDLVGRRLEAVTAASLSPSGGRSAGRRR
jgi:beta-N-acetylhexosaminidase